MLISASYEKTGIFNPYGKKIADASREFGIVCREVDLNEKFYHDYLSYAAKCLSKEIYLNEMRKDLISD